MANFPLRNIAYGQKSKLTKKEFEADLKKSLPGYCYNSTALEKDKWKYLGYENINE